MLGAHGSARPLSCPVFTPMTTPTFFEQTNKRDVRSRRALWFSSRGRNTRSLWSFLSSLSRKSTQRVAGARFRKSVGLRTLANAVVDDCEKKTSPVILTRSQSLEWGNLLGSNVEASYTIDKSAVSNLRNKSCTDLEGVNGVCRDRSGGSKTTETRVACLGQEGKHKREKTRKKNKSCVADHNPKTAYSARVNRVYKESALEKKTESRLARTFADFREVKSRLAYGKKLKDRDINWNISIGKVPTIKEGQFLHPSRHSRQARWFRLSVLQHEIITSLPRAKSHPERLLEQLKGVHKGLAALFCEMIGLSPDPSFKFDKKECDVFMESYFGSLQKRGNDSTTYVGLEPVGDDKDAERYFSVYLLRKALPESDPRKLPVAGQSFVERMTTPRKRIPDNLMHRRQLCLDAFRAQAKALVWLVTRERERRGKRSGQMRRSHTTKDSACYEVPGKHGLNKCIYKGMLYAEGMEVFDSRTFMAGRKNIVTSTPVRVKPILSGGKIRTITIGTWQSDILYAECKDVLAMIRKAEWSIFGRDVSDWWKGMSPRGERCWIRRKNDIVSGDLESATDNLDPMLAEIYIEELSALVSKEKRETWRNLARSITNRAYLEFGDQGGIQTKGQLMGSIVSFGALCLASRTFAIVKGKTSCRRLVSDLRERPWRVLRTCRGEGVNGDDIVFPGDHCEWELNVAACGGVVSRGKTLCNNQFFTVNSELWKLERGVWGKARFVRPSELFSWARTPFDPRDYKKTIHIRRNLLEIAGIKKTGLINWLTRAEIPRVYGGLGKSNKVKSAAVAASLSEGINRVRPPPTPVFELVWNPEVKPEVMHFSGWIDKSIKVEHGTRNVIWWKEQVRRMQTKDVFRLYAESKWLGCDDGDEVVKENHLFCRGLKKVFGNIPVASQARSSTYKFDLPYPPIKR